MNAGNIVFIDVPANPCRCFFVDPGADLLIAFFQVRRLLGDPFRVKLVEGPVTDLNPASYLQQHNNVSVIVDNAASVNLSGKPFFARTLEACR